MPSPRFKPLKKRCEERKPSSNVGKSSNDSKRHLFPKSPATVVEFDGNDLHRLVHAHDWDRLRHELKKRRSNQVNPLLSSDEKPSKLRQRLVKQSLGDSSRSIHKQNDPRSDDVSPRSSVHRGRSLSSLLENDSSGDTALHLAVRQHAPLDVIMGLLRENSNLAEAENRRGELALHVALRKYCEMELIAELVIAYPAAVMVEDSQGKTPLRLAVKIATKNGSKIPKKYRHWDRADTSDYEPGDDTDMMLRWQEEQEDFWTVVKWLLLASESHPRVHLNLRKSQNLLMDALIHAAPPSVMSLLISASSKSWESGDQGTSFACSALYLCIARRYPPLILESLVSKCPPQARNVRDETGMGLVSTQYIVGGFQKTHKEEWIVQTNHRDMMAYCLANNEISDAYPSFEDWWNKLMLLIRYCNSGNSRIPDDQLLHVALSNPDVPPTVVRLLLSLYPKASSVSDVASGAHPLHLACMTDTYAPRNYEPSLKDTETALEMVLHAQPEAVRYRYNGKLPLHLAIDAGKTWTEIKPLTSASRRSLSRRDPTTKLYPFQMMSMKRDYTESGKNRIAYRARNQYSQAEWSKFSSRKKRKAIKKAHQGQELDRLRTVFEFLRRSPELVKSGIVVRKPVHVARDTTGMGMVAAHYSVWCYAPENHKWKRLRENQRILNKVISSGELGVISDGQKSNEFHTWFTKLKFWIWYCFCGKEGSTPIDRVLVMPRSDDYLLHAAASNSDTPPQVISLLLSLFPSSAPLPLPGTHTYPLHIASSTTSYTPRDFEPRYPTMLSLLLKAYPDAAAIMSYDRLPLHIAIESGKTWEELQPLVETETRALRFRDVATGLYPFQLMAVHHTYAPEQRRRFQYLARNRNKRRKWKKMSQSDRTRQITVVQKEHRLEVVSTVFELLRRDPSLLIIQNNKEEDHVVSAAMLFGQAESNRSSLSLLGDVDSDSDDEDNDDVLRSLPSFGTSGSFDDDASIFSTFDVMSTISALHEDVDNTADNIVQIEDYTDASTIDTSSEFESSQHGCSESQDTRSDSSVHDQDLVQPVDEPASPPPARAESGRKMGTHLRIDDETYQPDFPTPDSRCSESNQRENQDTPHCISDDDIDDVKESSTRRGTYSRKCRKASLIREVMAGEDWGSLRPTPHSQKSPRSAMDASVELRETPQTQRSLEPDPLQAVIAEASDNLKAAPESTPHLMEDSLKAELTEASDNLQDVPEIQRKAVATQQWKLEVEHASGSLAHSIPTHPERTPIFVEKNRKEVADVENRVGMYRTGWTQTPAILERRKRQFGWKYVDTIARDKLLACVLCGEGKREVLMLPCRHLCLCSHCSVTITVDQCHTCGAHVENCMTVFL